MLVGLQQVGLRSATLNQPSTDIYCDSRHLVFIWSFPLFGLWFGASNAYCLMQQKRDSNVDGRYTQIRFTAISGCRYTMYFLAQTTGRSMRENRPVQHNEFRLAATRPYRTCIISCSAQLAHICRVIEAVGHAYQASPNLAFTFNHRGGKCPGFCGLRAAWHVGFMWLRINVL